VFEEGNVVAGKAYDWSRVRIVVGYADCCRRSWNAAQRSSLLLLPSAVLVCHSRGRSLDMISPALRICMETARARLALAGRPVRPAPNEGPGVGGDSNPDRDVNVYRTCLKVFRGSTIPTNGAVGVTRSEGPWASGRRT
jgi:hypothetical protein